jgi:uncharacterized metal-binding protein YceD (DUF177 family)
MSGLPAPEFSREVALDERQGLRRFQLEASPTERAALARRLGLIELVSLAGTGFVRPGPGGRWTVEGHLHAMVLQSCVVSLEPVQSTVEDSFELSFAPMDDDDTAEVDLSADADTEPLPLDGKLDVGEILAQQLSLALDPFPRAPGVGPGDRIESLEEGPARVAPFADLSARLRPKPPEGSGEA